MLMNSIIIDHIGHTESFPFCVDYIHYLYLQLPMPNVETQNDTLSGILIKTEETTKWPTVIHDSYSTVQQKRGNADKRHRPRTDEK